MGLSKPNVAKLARKGDIPGLVAALGNSDRAVRDAAIDALSEIGAPAISLLVEALCRAQEVSLPMGGNNDPDTPFSSTQAHVWHQIFSILEALGRMGEQAVDPLVAALRDKSRAPMARGYLATALGATGSPRAVRPLLFFATAKCPMQLQEGAICALYDFHEPEVAEALLGVLAGGGNPASAAVEGLVKMNELVYPSLLDIVAAGEDADDLPIQCIYAAFVLARLGDNSSFLTIRRACFNHDEDVRCAAIAAQGDLLAACLSRCSPTDIEHAKTLYSSLALVQENDFSSRVRGYARLALASALK